MAEKYRRGEYDYEDSKEYGSSTNRGAMNASDGRPGGYDDRDVFGHEEGHDVCYCII